MNRAAHFAGGRIVADASELKPNYTVSQWIWNGLDPGARPIAGWFLSHGVHLGLSGQGEHAGRLLLKSGDDVVAYGKTSIARWDWVHVALVRTDTTVQVYLDGKLEVERQISDAPVPSQLFIGGHANNENNWEGRLDEVAIFDRALTAEQIAKLADDGQAATSTTQTTLSEEDQNKGGRHWVDQATPAPRSPEEENASFQIEPGYTIELVAAEPLVMDPVAIAFDAQGTMFVAEYSDYPIGPPEEGAPPLSRIVKLIDQDGDGKMDQRIVFADQLNFCHSLMPFRGGILACAQTELILLTDTDADGIADQRELLFSGFVPAHAQMQVGCPRWGLDNRIYLNYGVGKVTQHVDNTTKTIPPNEFWIDPLTLDFGPASGTGQYGNTITAWGDRLFATNRNPIIATTMSLEEAAQNRFAPIRSIQYDVAPSGGDSKVFPLVAMKSNWLSHAGTHTSACGTTAYVGDGLGPAMVDSVFACEPIGHLVTRAIVTRDGSRLTSQRAQENADFLAATDTWFRPASLSNGPDGMLYLADMYRLWVEHPKFLPPEIAAQLDWRAGEDRGRIWRIVPVKTTGSNFYTPPSTTSDLVKMLGSENGWRRRTAQQILVEQQRHDAQPDIEKLFQTSDSPFARLHAIWTLEGLGRLSREMIHAGLNDAHPEVRANAVRLAKRHWADTPELCQAAMKLVDDTDQQVRFQLALALGQTDDPGKANVLASLLPSDGANSTFADAIVAASEKCSGEVLSICSADLPQQSILAERLAHVVGSRRDEAEMLSTLQVALSQKAPTGQLAVLKGLTTGLGNAKQFHALLVKLPKAEQQLATQLLDLAHDPRQSPTLRRDALQVIRLAKMASDDFFAELCTPREPALVQQEAVATLVSPLTPARSQLLAELWPELEPGTRDAAISLLIKSTPGVEFLLTALRLGTISRTSLSLDQQSQLRQHRDAAIRKQAEQLLGQAANSDRAAVLKQYQSVTKTIGSATTGKAIFLKNCAKCHTPTEPGQPSVGPDLADSQNRPREAILFDILNPSGKVEPKYAASQILTDSGQSYSGIVIHQTPQAIVLQLADGKTQEITRAEIELFQTSDRSLMPDGLEKEISLDQMADLLEFLQSPLPKR
ncbi:PVC-type heme-binding CxxCH protein [Bremerella cremea]|uniref:PVC-type heme-binding CxxCH protein n=1 Tax=Bremerella cremea TaxID=1031537 RepID=UPI0031EB5630